MRNTGWAETLVMCLSISRRYSANEEIFEMLEMCKTNNGLDGFEFDVATTLA
jgi:hypothetical protein